MRLYLFMATKRLPPHFVSNGDVKRCAEYGQEFGADARPSLRRAFAEHIRSAHAVKKNLEHATSKRKLSDACGTLLFIREVQNGRMSWQTVPSAFEYAGVPHFAIEYPDHPPYLSLEFNPPHYS